MDKEDSFTNNNFDNWKSWSPDVVLHALVSESKSPLTTIKGYAQILSCESSQELHATTITGILNSVEHLEIVMKDVMSYLNDYQVKDKKTPSSLALTPFIGWNSWNRFVYNIKTATLSGRCLFYLASAIAFLNSSNG